jgi:chromosome segregation and condensation protein ScpB
VSDTFKTGNAGSPSEERVETQALSVDLREAVMACLSGGESRRWTVLELVERFKNLGICATRASVTSALAELGLELELSSWAPWRLLERGTQWILAPESELLKLLSSVRRLPLKEASDLSEEHKAVLLVVIGYRQKGGVSKTRVGEILGLEASSILDDLLSFGLIYCDPSKGVEFLAADAIGFACSGLAIPHRHPGTQRARGVVPLAERNSGNSETGSFL